MVGASFSSDPPYFVRKLRAFNGRCRADQGDGIAYGHRVRFPVEGEYRRNPLAQRAGAPRSWVELPSAPPQPRALHGKANNGVAASASPKQIRWGCVPFLAVEVMYFNDLARTAKCADRRSSWAALARIRSITRGTVGDLVGRLTPACAARRWRQSSPEPSSSLSSSSPC